jgi:hypothetical protein
MTIALDDGFDKLLRWHRDPRQDMFMGIPVKNRTPIFAAIAFGPAIARAAKMF